MCSYGSSKLNKQDSTITSTLSATIAAEFGSLAVISWLGSAYLIALAVVQPLSGKLTDIFGRRAGLLTCSLFFAIGNAICGLAQSKTVIIFGRVAAGMGGGGLNAISTFVGNDLISLRSRGMVQGFGNVVFGAALGLGGVLGGSINDVWGWRWAFLVLVPPSLLCAAGNAYFVPGPVKKSKNSSLMTRLRRIDFAGSLALTMALALMLWSLNYEGDDGFPSQAVLAVGLPISGLLLIAFAMIEVGYAKEPIIPMPLLKVRNMSCASLANFFNSMTIYIMIFYIPIYWQARGFATSIVGIRMLPEPVGSALGSLGCGLIMRVTGKYGVLKVVILAILVAGCVGYLFCDLNTFDWLPELYLFMIGLGFVGSLTTMLLVTLSAIEQDVQAVATSVLYAGRAVGATIGVTASGVLFRRVLIWHMPWSSAQGSSGTCHLEGGKATTCSMEQLDAYMHALRAVFILATGLAIAGSVCGIITQNFRLHQAPDHR